MPVYFAQPRDGGPIKIGATRDLSTRVAAMNHASPNGIDLITAIPGGTTREGFIQTALRSSQLNGEWFKSDALLWRVILEAIDFGDLTWVPDEPQRPLNMGEVRQVAMKAFGTARKARAFLGRASGFSGAHTGVSSGGETGDALFLKSWVEQSLPSYITAAFARTVLAWPPSADWTAEVPRPAPTKSPEAA